MQIELETVQTTFDEVLRRANAQAWDILDPFVAYTSTVTGDAVHSIEVDLGHDLATDVPSDAGGMALLDDLSQRIGQTVKEAATAPLAAVVALLQASGVREVTVPAGCDLADHGEIANAFLRAVDGLEPGTATVLIPAGSQDWFMAALDRDQPAMIGNWRVRLVPCADLLDRTGLDLEASATNAASGKITAEEFYDRVAEAAKRSPWYVLVHQAKDRSKPFQFQDRQRLHLAGPKLTARGRWGLRWNEASVSRSSVCRVTLSRILLARDLPKAKTQEATK